MGPGSLAWGSATLLLNVDPNGSGSRCPLRRRLGWSVRWPLWKGACHQDKVMCRPGWYRAVEALGWVRGRAVTVATPEHSSLSRHMRFPHTLLECLLSFSFQEPLLSMFKHTELNVKRVKSGAGKSFYGQWCRAPGMRAHGHMQPSTMACRCTEGFSLLNLCSQGVVL